MDFTEARQRYWELKQRYEAGFLRAEQFQARVEELMVQDEQGRWWMLGVESGKWYVSREGQWVEEEPPTKPVETTAPHAAPPRETVAAEETVPSTTEPPMLTRQTPPPAQPLHPTYTPPLPAKAAPGRRWTLLLLLGGLGIGVIVVAAALFYLAGHLLKPSPPPTSAAAQATEIATPTTYVIVVTATPESEEPTPTSTFKPLAKTASPTAKATETPAAPPSPGLTAVALPATPTSTPPAEPTEAPTVEPTEAPPTTPASAPAQPTPKPQPSGGLSGKLAFSLLQNIEYKVYVVQLPDKTYIASVGHAQQPNLSSDGQRLAVNGHGGGGMETIWSMNPEGKEAKEVTCYTTNAHPFWSPDGSRLVFDDAELDPRGGRLYIQKENERNCELHKYPLVAAGTPLQEIVGGASSYMYPLWSGEDRIIFRGCDSWAGTGGVNCGLWSINPDGSKPAQITSNPQHIPTDTGGGIVAFMSPESGNWEIYTVGLSGGEPHRLTDNKAMDGLPTISPDGQQIAFISDREGQWAIWVMGIDGSNPQKLMDFNPDMGAVDKDSWTLERMSWSP